MTNKKEDDILRFEVNIMRKNQNPKLLKNKIKTSKKSPIDIFVYLIISFAIGVVLIFWGVYYENNFCLNLGLSFLSGTIVGIFCNISITKYYRRKDKAIQENNQKLLDEKNTYIEQANVLTTFTSIYEDIIANLHVFIGLNSELIDGEKADGYYDVCKSLWYLPGAMNLNDAILSEKEINFIIDTHFHLTTIRNYMEKKEYSKIIISEELSLALKNISECMQINCRINERIRELETKIK